MLTLGNILHDDGTDQVQAELDRRMVHAQRANELLDEIAEIQRRIELEAVKDEQW